MADAPREEVHKNEMAEKEISFPDGLSNISKIILVAISCEAGGMKEIRAFEISYRVIETNNPITDMKIVIKGMAEIKM